MLRGLHVGGGAIDEQEEAFSVSDSSASEDFMDLQQLYNEIYGNPVSTQQLEQMEAARSKGAEALRQKLQPGV